MIINETDADNYPCVRPSHLALHVNGPCIGAKCLAWCWLHDDNQSFKVHESLLESHWKGHVVLSRPDNDGMVEIKAPPPTQGQCGFVR